MTRADVAAVLAAGADLAQCGTAFLRADEAGTHATARAALASPRAARTALTRAFSGRLARGLDTAFMARFRDHALPIAPYPVQNALTADLRRAAAAAGDPDRMAIWAGTGAPLARPGPAADIVRALSRSPNDDARDRLHRSTRGARSPRGFATGGPSGRPEPGLCAMPAETSPARPAPRRR